MWGGVRTRTRVCVRKRWEAPHSCAPHAAEQDPCVSVQERAEPTSPTGSPGSPRSSAFLSVQPVLQPTELIFYLSAFEMHTEDSPRPEASWQAGAWGSPGEDGGGGLPPSQDTLRPRLWVSSPGAGEGVWGGCASGQGTALAHARCPRWGTGDAVMGMSSLRAAALPSSVLHRAPGWARLWCCRHILCCVLPYFSFWLRLKLGIDDARENQRSRPAKALQPLLELSPECSRSHLSGTPFNCALHLPCEN